MSWPVYATDCRCLAAAGTPQLTYTEGLNCKIGKEAPALARWTSRTLWEGWLLL